MPLLLVEAIPFNGPHSFQWNAFLLVETISLFLKLFLLVEANPFNESSSFYWNPFRLFRVILFSGSRSFQWKPFYILKAVHFSRSHPFQWKPLLSVEVFFFYRGFLSLPFTNYRTAGKGGGHFFTSSLLLPPA